MRDPVCADWLGLAQQVPAKVEHVDADVDEGPAAGFGFVEEPPASADGDAAGAHPAGAGVIDLAGQPLGNRLPGGEFGAAETALQAVHYDFFGFSRGFFDSFC